MRHEIADGLKALALLGVFMVNGLGYALAPNYPMQLGAPMPLDSALAQAIHTLVLTVFMGKALPLLAFLFGYSMTHYAKRTTTPAQIQRRQYKLLFIGVLHGTLLYFGDILTAYALIGLWLCSAPAMRGRRLVLRWRWWMLVSCALLLYRLWIEWQNNQRFTVLDISSELPTFVTLGHTAAYSTFLALNATSYAEYWLGWLVSYYAPLHIGLFITGVLVARYQWLSLKPRIPRLFLWPWLSQSWPLALLANALLALASVHAIRQNGIAANIYWITVLNVPLGVWLVASGLTRFMVQVQTQQTIPTWLLWLAPAGRHTLAMYLGLSFTLMLCGRLGLFASELAWNHTAVWFAALAALWLGAVWLGRLATKKGMRDPVSRWLSR